jgi:hypothetical protein
MQWAGLSNQPDIRDLSRSHCLLPKMSELGWEYLSRARNTIHIYRVIFGEFTLTSQNGLERRQNLVLSKRTFTSST